MNAFLTEVAQTNRVLSGEAIIFQNETHDIFRDIINASESPLDVQGAAQRPGAEEESSTEPPATRLKVRYVTTILLEFLRSVLENQIPLQPAQQTMLIKFVFKAKQYAMLHQLLQFYVLNDSLELARVLITLGSRGVTKQAYYEPAFQLGLDMLQRLKQYQEIVVALINED